MKRGKSLARRTPLEATTPLERRKPIAQGDGLKRSKRPRAKRDTPRRGRIVLDPAARQQLRQAVYDRAGGLCEAGLTPDCPGRLDRHAFEWHHRKLRSQGGDDVIANSLCVCSGCHSWAHAHPAEAKSAGVIVPRWADPAAYALTLPDGRIVRLSDRYDPVFDVPNTTDTPDLGEAS